MDKSEQIQEEVEQRRHKGNWVTARDPISALLFDGWQPKYPPKANYSND